MNIRHSIIALLLFCSLPAAAQFISVDWDKHPGDSLLPVSASVVELPADYKGYSYSACIEYPEYEKMTAEEVRRYSLETKYGELSEQPQAECFVGVQAKRPQLDVAVLPVVKRGGGYYKLNSYKLVVNRTAAHNQLRTSALSEQERYAASSVLAKGRWVRISVKENGVHKITAAELKSMGFGDINSVRLFGYGGHMLPEKGIENLPDDLREVPLWREKEYVLFYANGVLSWNYERDRFIHTKNVYSEYGCYFLTEGGTPAAFESTAVEEEPAKTLTVYPDYYVIDNDKKSHCQYGRVLVDDYDYSKGRTVKYKFPITGVASNEALLNISFATNGAASSRVAISDDVASVGTLTVSQCSSGEVGKLVAGKFSVKNAADNMNLKLVQNTSSASVTGHLDYLALNYTRTLALRGSQTSFRGNELDGYATFEIDGCNPNVRVWDVSSNVPVELKGTLAGSRYSVVAPATNEHEFVAVDVKGTFPSVNVCGDVPNQDLHAVKQADMVIIIPSNGLFKNVAERLADAHRQMDSLTVEVVTAQQVYNEFSSGTPDVTAYRRFMKMLYDRAATADEAPRYLLMMGDSWYDNRLITIPNASQDDYLLCFESLNSVNAVRSYVLEDYMGFLDDGEGSNFLREKVDIGVGRIPTTSPAIAGDVVNKIIAYMQNKETGAWQNVVALLADDGDRLIPNQHMIDAERIASVLATTYPSYIIDRIYWDDYPAEKSATGVRYPEVTKAIKERLKKGALVVNYSGHGNATTFAHELTWKSSDMAELTAPRWPFWVTASCDIGPFDKGESSSAETALVNPKGGAIGLLTTTRTVLQSYNSVLNVEFTKQLFSPVNSGEMLALGDVLRRTKGNLVEYGRDMSENKLQYVLLGDPALKLKYPEFRVRVDKLNGADASQDIRVSAGSVLTVEGSIINRDSTLVDDFSGVLHASLFDCMREISTRDNTGLGVFKYTAHDKTLFSGSDSIKNGRFSIKMPVPMDILYADTIGLLNFFAVDSASVRMAHGHFNGFTVGGTAPGMENDGTGPEIALYLNTSDFKSGDKVNSTPCLWVELFDENGINTLGTGVGHDIVAIIDNDPAFTYNLNSLFTQRNGSYKAGTIMLPLDRLGEGKHTLMLRAWDLLNNSSTVEVEFEVEPSLLPEVLSLKASSLPFVCGESAEFVIMHNRPQSEIEVTIELFSVQGRMLWKNTERVVCDGMEYRYSWNGAISGGRPLPTGVFVARAYIASDNGVSEPKNLKVLVVNNK